MSNIEPTSGASGLATFTDFEPRVVAFLCNWCAYAAADKAGAAQLAHPSNVRVVRLMCMGRMEPQFVLEAFYHGVLMLGCHPGDCHYKEQNFRAIQRHRLLLRFLSQHGIASERCRLDFVSAAEGARLVQLLREVVSSVRVLGPLSPPRPGPNPRQIEP